MTCIHDIQKALPFYAFMRHFFTIVERITVVMYHTPLLKMGLMTKSIIHNNIA